MSELTELLVLGVIQHIVWDNGTLFTTQEAK